MEKKKGKEACGRLRHVFSHVIIALAHRKHIGRRAISSLVLLGFFGVSLFITLETQHKEEIARTSAGERKTGKEKSEIDGFA